MRTGGRCPVPRDVAMAAARQLGPRLFVDSATIRVRPDVVGVKKVNKGAEVPGRFRGRTCSDGRPGRSVPRGDYGHGPRRRAASSTRQTQGSNRTAPLAPLQKLWQFV